MPSVKTYRQINKNNENHNFGISKMEHIYDARNGKKDAPHRHDFYTVLIIKTAKGKHIIDFNEYPLSNEQIFFIGPGQVHQVAEERKSSGYSLTFSNQFLIENNIPISFIEELQLFNSYGQSPPLTPSIEELKSINYYCQQMTTLNTSATKFKNDAIGAFLKLLLIKCNNLKSLAFQPDAELNTSNLLLKQFKTILKIKFKKWHSAQNYANALNVSPDHLTRVIKSLTGNTVKEHLQTCITIEAKRLLYFSTLSNKEIAYQLGFSEPANFSTFFKKMTGKSPSQFKKRI